MDDARREARRGRPGAGALSRVRRGPGPVARRRAGPAPPDQAPDLPRLEAFLAALPRGQPVAVEFKNPAWRSEALHAALAAAGAALCVTDTEEDATPLVATADFGYLRLRRDDYDDTALARWAERIAAQPWRAAYVFFRHEDTARGTGLAARLLELAGGDAASPALR